METGMLIAVIVILVIISLAGYVVYSQMQNQDEEDESAVETTTAATTTAPTTTAPTTTAAMTPTAAAVTTAAVTAAPAVTTRPPRQRPVTTPAADRPWCQRLCPSCKPGAPKGSCGGCFDYPKGCRPRDTPKPNENSKPPKPTVTKTPKPTITKPPKPTITKTPKPLKCDHKTKKKGWEYTTRVDGGGGTWKCPGGYQENGCSWGDGEVAGILQCRRKEKLTKPTKPTKPTITKTSDGEWQVALSEVFDAYPACCDDNIECNDDDAVKCTMSGRFAGQPGTVVPLKDVKRMNIASFFDASKQNGQGKDLAWWKKQTKGRTLEIRNGEDRMTMDIVDTCVDWEYNNAKAGGCGGQVSRTTGAYMGWVSDFIQALDNFGDSKTAVENYTAPVDLTNIPKQIISLELHTAQRFWGVENPRKLTNQGGNRLPLLEYRWVVAKKGTPKRTTAAAKKKGTPKPTTLTLTF